MQISTSKSQNIYVDSVQRITTNANLIFVSNYFTTYSFDYYYSFYLFNKQLKI